MFSRSADRNQPSTQAAPTTPGLREMTTAAPPVMSVASDDSVIAREDAIEGTIRSRGTVRVLGQVKGRIEATAVYLEEGAHVEADIVADEAVIAGEHVGSLTCRQRLEIRATGRVTGRVETFKLMLHEGASMDGEMHMLKQAGQAEASSTIRGTAALRPAVSAPSGAAPASGASNGSHTASVAPRGSAAVSGAALATAAAGPESR